MLETVAALVPLKLKSRRLPNKNFLRLGDRPLSYYIFDTLVGLRSIEKVFCFTSQHQILSLLPQPVELLMRPKRLDGDDVKANELFRFAVEQIPADIIVLCHATSPYVRSESIHAGVDAVKSHRHDCAIAVQRHQTYAWYAGKPLNYDPGNMEQTQNLSPVLTETSGFYVFRKKDYLHNNTRIGKKPCFVEVDFKESTDIDEPQDFALATLLYDYDPKKPRYSTDEFFVNIANNGVQFKNIKHISFDLDGVLIDSLGVMEAAWSSAMNASGQSIPFENYKALIGIPFDEILKTLGCPQDSFDIIADAYNSVSSEKLDSIHVYEGVKKALAQAKDAGIRVSLVTSKNKKRTNEILDRLFADIEIDIVVTPEDVAIGRGKPNPDPILLACVKLGVDPYHTIYVGDMAPDREAATRAGAHFVHAAWGYSALPDVKDMWFSHIQDMMDYILN